MKRITLLFLTLSLILAVALPAAAAGGPHGRRAIQRRAQRVRRVRNHRMFIDDAHRPILQATPAVQRIPPLPDGLPELQQPQLPVKIPVTPPPRIQPPVIKPHPHGPDWQTLSQRLSTLKQRLSHLPHPLTRTEH